MQILQTYQRGAAYFCDFIRWEAIVFIEVSHKLKYPDYMKKKKKLGEIRTFQFLTDFTKNALASHIVKAQKCTAPLWKARKIEII